MRWPALALAAGLATWRCSGPQEVAPAGPQIVTERAQACRTMLSEFVRMDLRTMPEADIERAMDRASSQQVACSAAFDDEARSVGEEQMAQHEGRQFSLYSLMFEGTLSERFDNYAGYCDIVADMFQLLLTNVGELEATLVAGDLPESERLQLVELRDLDLEAIDVLFIASEEHCQ